MLLLAPLHLSSSRSLLRLLLRAANENFRDDIDQLFYLPLRFLGVGRLNNQCGA